MMKDEQVSINKLKLSATVLQWGSPMYELRTALPDDSEVEIYVVRNKVTGVVEFTTEVLPFAREWISHFQKRLDDMDNPPKDEDAIHAAYAKPN